MRVTIAMPTNRRIQPRTAQCLLELVAKSKHDLHLLIAEHGYTIAENRNYIAVQAINNKSEYLMMVDDDMTFEVETLDKLLANNKDICGVAYHPRSGADRMKAVGEITALAEVNLKEYINLETNTDPKYKTLFECYATGTGIILIRVSIFEQIARPWFEFEFFDSGQCKEGEDWHFCIVAKKAGFQTWTEPRIKVGHLGEYLY